MHCDQDDENVSQEMHEVRQGDKIKKLNDL